MDVIKQNAVKLEHKITDEEQPNQSANNQNTE
jgi:hypothetical protein